MNQIKPDKAVFRLNLTGMNVSGRWHLLIFPTLHLLIADSLNTSLYNNQAFPKASRTLLMNLGHQPCGPIGGHDALPFVQFAVLSWQLAVLLRDLFCHAELVEASDSRLQTSDPSYLSDFLTSRLSDSLPYQLFITCHK